MYSYVMVYFSIIGVFCIFELNVLSFPLWLQMLSCLEYMYHDLGLVKEFNMNPITLKRWLVKSKRAEASHVFVF